MTEFNEQQAIYLQIAEYVCDKVIANQWIPESKIPSIRDLAVELQVNPNTVMRAYDQLQESGVIYNKRGLGHFICENASLLIMDERRHHFFTTDLPRIARNMEHLGISPDDLKSKLEELISK